jgi:hypothetical protein
LAFPILLPIFTSQQVKKRKTITQGSTIPKKALKILIAQNLNIIKIKQIKNENIHKNW